MLAATLLIAGGCSFDHGSVPSSLQPDAEVDEPTPPSDAARVTRTCRYPDFHLRLCLEFDDRQLDPLVIDGSPSELDAMASGVTETTRGTRPAAALTASSRIDVPEATALDIASGITLELWVSPMHDQPSFLIANSGQYQLAVDRYGFVSCYTGNETLTSITAIGRSIWSHVACTFDGEVTRIYVNGNASACTSGASISGIPTTGAQGTQIAPGLTGAIDDVRIYSRPLSAGEVCGHADKTSCVSSCSGGDDT